MDIAVNQPPDVFVVNQTTIYYVIGLNAYQADVIQEPSGEWVSTTGPPLTHGIDGSAKSGAMYLKKKKRKKKRKEKKEKKKKKRKK